MGSIKKLLSNHTLPDREPHHSRTFVDLAENIHIHFREYRFVFNLDEFFEFMQTLKKSETDIFNYLFNNTEYKEGSYPTTLMIAGGRDQQLKFIKNSPKPNESFYMNNELNIELQDEFVTDEIHIHYRDFRLAMDRSRFKIFANSIKEANDILNEFEKNNTYIRKGHNDRIIQNFNNKNESNNFFLQGVNQISLNKIRSKLYYDIETQWSPNKKFIETLKKQYTKSQLVPPIILSKLDEKDTHYIIDGHHRYYACLKLNKSYIDAIVTDFSYEETNNLRIAINHLNKFDVETNFEYYISDFMKSYLGYKLNRFYRDDYSKKIKKNSYIYQILRKIKYFFFGKEKLFKNFFEKHNR